MPRSRGRVELSEPGAHLAQLLNPQMPDPQAVGYALETAPTGAPLVRVLEVVDPAASSPTRVDAFVLVEAVAAAGRMASWAYALQARLAAELARRPDMGPSYRHAPGSVTVTAQQSAVQALSMRPLRSDRETRALVRHGLAFDGLLAETGTALAAGRIAVPAARIIAERLHEQTWQVATAVQEQVLDRAPDRTPAQVRLDVEKALAQVDPEHAAERHAHARTRRRVTHPRAEADAMASMHVVLPAPHAVAIDTVLEDCARTARAAGDPRTLDQLRADGLVDLFLHPPTPTRTDPDASPGSDADTGAGATSAAGPAAPATDPVTTTLPGPGPHGPTDARIQVLVTVALSTLLGVDDQPGDLAGYGPLDAVQTRALAHGGTWRRLITDPLSGAVLDHGRTRYRPPAALAAHIRHRDKTCTRPGCTRPAIRCDLDHTTPFPTGTTSASNLGPLCRTHHRHKTAGTLTLHQHEPGVFTWTDRSGHTYRTRPGTDQPRQHLTHHDTGPPPPF